MALEQLELETGLNKVDYSIKLLQDNEPQEGYYLAFSGGKDSVVIYDLAIKSGVKFDAHYCVSPIDPPQIYKFIKEHYPDIQWDYHARGFWKLVDSKGLPMRTSRWCCEIIKEAGGDGRDIIVGIRSSESVKRSHQCYIQLFNPKKKTEQGKTIISPILKFNDFDVWQYIYKNNLPYCELYDKGFIRIGCVLCPMSGKDAVAREEKYFPKIANNWLRACNRIVEQRKARGYKNKRGGELKHHFETGEEMYKWWTSR